MRKNILVIMVSVMLAVTSGFSVMTKIQSTTVEVASVNIADLNEGYVSSLDDTTSFLD